MSKSLTSSDRLAEPLRQTGPNDDRSDEELVRDVASQDETALRELIARHARAVKSISRRICYDESEVNCVASEVFWELWQRARAFDGRRATVRTFLLTIARTRSIDRRRGAASRARVYESLVSHRSSSDEKECDLPADELLLDEQARHVRDAIKALPAQQQQAIVLAFFDGMTHEQVAKRLNAPLGTIKTRIRSGIQHLRELLAEFKHSGE